MTGHGGEELWRRRALAQAVRDLPGLMSGAGIGVVLLVPLQSYLDDRFVEWNAMRVGVTSVALAFAAAALCAFIRAPYKQRNAARAEVDRLGRQLASARSTDLEELIAQREESRAQEARDLEREVLATIAVRAQQHASTPTDWGQRLAEVVSRCAGVRASMRAAADENRHVDLLEVPGYIEWASSFQEILQQVPLAQEALEERFGPNLLIRSYGIERGLAMCTFAEEFSAAVSVADAS